MRWPRARRAVLPTLALALIAAVAAAEAGGPAAGSDAEVRRMIESLRPAAAPASRSTGPAAPSARADQAGRTRNLVIEPNAAPAADSPAAGASPGPTPGLSLAISFEPNSAQLRPESGDTLGALVAAMMSAELRQQRFVIEGHTDANGTPAQNLRLSRERAEQVLLFLTTLGVSADRLVAVGKGATEPVNARDPRAAENRRVRVVALP